MATKTILVCGIPTKAGGVIAYDARGPFPVGHPDRVALGTYAPLSKPGAKRLAEALGVPVPRLNRSVALCADQTLDNVSGTFQVTRHTTGDFRGARKRRRR